MLRYMRTKDLMLRLIAYLLYCMILFKFRTIVGYDYLMCAYLSYVSNIIYKVPFIHIQCKLFDMVALVPAMGYDMTIYIMCA